MARGHLDSLARVPTPTQPWLPRRLRRFLEAELAELRPALEASARACQADRYRKHFDAAAHAAILLFHGLSGSPSLRQTHEVLALAPALRGVGGAGATTVSFSQLCASTTSRPPAFLGGVLPTLAARARRRAGRAGLPPDLLTWDSTFLRLSLKLSPWLPGAGGADVPGVRVQVQYAPALDLPEWVDWHTTRTNDGRALDALLADPDRLAGLRGWTLAFDLGYYGHRRLAALRAAEVHFVCRRQAQAAVAIEAERPVQAPLPGAPRGRIAVRRDCRVTLGSADNRRGAVLGGLRLVVATVAPTPKAARRGAQPVTYELLTDRWDLAAADVVQAYLWRWDIEQFFRWLKSHVRLPRLLGHGERAVELSLYLALAVHLLSLLAAEALGWGRRSPRLLRLLAWSIAHLDPLALLRPLPAARQLPLPNWPLLGPAG